MAGITEQQGWGFWVPRMVEGGQVERTEGKSNSLTKAGNFALQHPKRGSHVVTEEVEDQRR